MQRRLSPLLWCWLACFIWLPADATPLAPSSPKAFPRIHVVKRAFVTDDGKIFVPFGVTYYRPNTGWAPQVWKQFDAEATRKDFAIMRRQGVNCIRVFLSYGSFYSQPGVLNPEGLEKFDRFLALAEEAGIYVHPTGPDGWEGRPTGFTSAVDDEASLIAREEFWKLFAARYRGRSVIFAYDLKNEPHLAWSGETLPKRWNSWLAKKYATREALVAAWGNADPGPPGNAPIPPVKDDLKSRRLLDYQTFREEIADEWIRRQAAAIKSVDPDALVTVGLIQWSVPVRLPGDLSHYSAFRPERVAPFLDFMEIHFYPTAEGAFEYRGKEDEDRNLAYLESVVREVARHDKPAILAEFGWYGGAKPRFDRGIHPVASEEQQAQFCKHVIETSAGFVCGWLNWGFYDAPEATDCSELTGLATADGKIKAWGATFKQLEKKYHGKRLPLPKIGPRPAMDWDACVTSIQAERAFRRKYFEAYEASPERQR